MFAYLKPFYSTSFKTPQNGIFGPNSLKWIKTPINLDVYMPGD